MQYGHASIPRVGSEVVVDYLDGDPDQPIVTGMAYNPTKKHAYDLPAHKTRSYWKDQTHKGEGFNEIRFESENGREEIFVHAERDRNVEIENDSTHFVGRNKAEQIEANCFTQIQQNSYERIGRSQYSEIRGDRIDFVGGMSSLLSHPYIRGKRHKDIWKSFLKLPNLPSIGNWFSIVSGYRIAKTVFDDSESIGGTKTISSGAHFNVSSNASVSLSARENIIVDADETIIIRTGDAAIILKKDGRIAIAGKELLISTGETKIDAEKTVTVKGAKIKLN